ncbi:MAG: hypothetical protein ACKO1L_13535 [Brachymonas sp.]
MPTFLKECRLRIADQDASARVGWLAGLGSQSSTASLDLYEAHGPTPIGPLTQLMKVHWRLAVQGDVDLGVPPKNSGVASWQLQNSLKWQF